MIYSNLGKSGLSVNAVSLGSQLTFGKQITDTTAEQLMIVAYDKGVNFFKNTEKYAQGKSEIVMPYNMFHLPKLEVDFNKLYNTDVVHLKKL